MVLFVPLQMVALKSRGLLTSQTFACDTSKPEQAASLSKEVGSDLDLNLSSKSRKQRQ